MKFKYMEGNGLESSHTHEYVRTHCKEKDGLECGCDFCLKMPDFYEINLDYIIRSCKKCHCGESTTMKIGDISYKVIGTDLYQYEIQSIVYDVPTKYWLKVTNITSNCFVNEHYVSSDSLFETPRKAIEKALNTLYEEESAINMSINCLLLLEEKYNDKI